MGSIALQIPVVGQPNSTEAPKVAADMTAIQTVINGNIDPSNLSTATMHTFVQLLSAGQLQLAYGASGTIASGASTTITHGLGRTPGAIILTTLWSDNTASASWTTYGASTTQFSAINKGSTSGAFYWVALG